MACRRDGSSGDASRSTEGAVMTEATAAGPRRFNTGDRVFYWTDPRVCLPATVVRPTATRVVITLDDAGGFARTRVVTPGRLTPLLEADALDATTTPEA
jgi:hypothetical protein